MKIFPRAQLQLLDRGEDKISLMFDFNRVILDDLHQLLAFVQGYTFVPLKLEQIGPITRAQILGGDTSWELAQGSDGRILGVLFSF